MENISKSQSPQGKSDHSSSGDDFGVNEKGVESDSPDRSKGDVIDSSVNSTSSKKDDPMLTEKTSPDDLDLKWERVKCKVCGLLQEGKNVKIPCPKCGNDNPDMFDELD